MKLSYLFFLCCVSVTILLPVSRGSEPALAEEAFEEEEANDGDERRLLTCRQLASKDCNKMCENMKTRRLKKKCIAKCKARYYERMRSCVTTLMRACNPRPVRMKTNGMTVHAQLQKDASGALACASNFTLVEQGPKKRRPTLQPGSPGSWLGTAGGSTLKCKKCYAFCQTITFLNTYDNAYDLGGGMSPSECVDAAVDKCGAGWNTILTGATCTS